MQAIRLNRLGGAGMLASSGRTRTIPGSAIATGASRNHPTRALGKEQRKEAAGFRGSLHA